MKFNILLNIFLINYQFTNAFWNNKHTKIITKLNLNPEKISLESLMNNIENHNINNIYFSEDLKNIYSNNENGYETVTTSNPILSNTILDLSHKNHINTIIQENINPIKAIINLASNTFDVIIIFFLIGFIIRFFRNSGNQNFPMQQMPPLFQTGKKADIIKFENISLSSWAGSREVFEECTEIVSYFKNSTIYDDVGAIMPKGILLEGPPGTGKTLLAKAIASESNVTFISISASELIEVFVGVGSLKVRNLFKEARDNAPCIIFIDEIDSIGKQRGNILNSANDEREQTLNQLLAEMDGFKENKGVIVLAATNRKDTLDQALIRPGRFDRIIKIPLPDKLSRKEILKLYIKNKNTINININLLSELTAGFSGAQIKNLINEGAINAARLRQKVITQKNIEDAIEKLVVGIIKTVDIREDDIKKRVAIHELGHAITTAYFREYFELSKVSIQSTYNGAGGYTLLNERPEIIDGGLYTKDLMKKKLIISLGGKASENIFYGEDNVSLGSTQDLKEANSLARRMVFNYGFGSSDLEIFYGENNNIYSDNTLEKIDQEILNLINDAYSEAFIIIKKNKDIINILIDELIKDQILSGERIYNEIKN